MSDDPPSVLPRSKLEVHMPPGAAVPKIRKIETVDEQQQRECIRVAEDLVARAKAGEITGFVVVCDCPGNDWMYFQTANQNRIQLLGKVRLCEHRIADTLFIED